MSKRFFEKPKGHSKVKSNIVSEYFDAWANVMVNSVKKRENQKIAYVDLFSGPGRYQDGTPSTPLLVLEKAIQKPEIAKRLMAVFNDANRDSVETLREEIGKLKGIEQFTLKPIIFNDAIEYGLAEYFSGTKMAPTLTFLDPWGYKGLSLELLDAFLKDWGCDCIFFFNYNRINMHISNNVLNTVRHLFGEERALILSNIIDGMPPDERENTIIEWFSEALSGLGYHRPLFFRFMDEYGKRTTHYLMLVSKHPLAYEIMKRIMKKYSSTSDLGIPSFAYNPFLEKQSFFRFESEDDMNRLKSLLVDKYSSTTLSFGKLVEGLPVSLPYLNENYREAVNRLEAEGKLLADPPLDARKVIKGKTSVPPHVKLTFI